mgnify:CR=1 FL=1
MMPERSIMCLTRSSRNVRETSPPRLMRGAPRGRRTLSLPLTSSVLPLSPAASANASTNITTEMAADCRMGTPESTDPIRNAAAAATPTDAQSSSSRLRYLSLLSSIPRARRRFSVTRYP